ALVRLAWGEFMKGLENSDHELLITVKLLLEKVSAMASDLKQEAFDGRLQSPLPITQLSKNSPFGRIPVDLASNTAAFLAVAPQGSPTGDPCGETAKQRLYSQATVDQTTEVTVNKDTQTPEGNADFSLKPTTIQRYYITAEYRSAFLGQLRDM
ncbi:hypothetical protein QZH41_019680, partial [Actinostola sp. cb2023]